MNKILVIDDDALIRGLMVKALQSAGYEIDEASDGEQGIQYLQSGSYDLVITDLVMPNKSGIGVGDYIEENRLAVPILVVSAYSAHPKGNNILTVSDHFATERLSKPFHKSELLDAVARLLQRSGS